MAFGTALIKFGTEDVTNVVTSMERSMRRRVSKDPRAGHDGSATTDSAYWEGSEIQLRGIMVDGGGATDAQQRFTSLAKVVDSGKQLFQARAGRVILAQAAAVGYGYQAGSGFVAIKSMEVTLQADEPYFRDTTESLKQTDLSTSGSTTDTITNTTGEANSPQKIRLTTASGSPGAGTEWLAGTYVFVSTSDGNRSFSIAVPSSSGIGNTHYLEIDTLEATVKRVKISDSSEEDWSQYLAGELWDVLGGSVTSTPVTIQHPLGMGSTGRQGRVEFRWFPRFWTE